MCIRDRLSLASNNVIFCERRNNNGLIRWKYYYFLSIYFEEEGSKEKELHGGQNIRTTLITRLEYVSDITLLSHDLQDKK